VSALLYPNSSAEDNGCNRIEYLYERDEVRTDGSHQWDQVYLKTIRYIDYGATAAPQFKDRAIYNFRARDKRHLPRITTNSTSSNFVRIV
jgi:hypothetical protein